MRAWGGLATALSLSPPIPRARRPPPAPCMPAGPHTCPTACLFLLAIPRHPPTPARYDVSNSNFASCEPGKGAACFGGMPKLATAIGAARAAAAAAGDDSLTLFAGDIFAGTSYDVAYTSQGDQIAPEFLEALGVQAMALGNHEVRVERAEREAAGQLAAVCRHTLPPPHALPSLTYPPRNRPTFRFSSISGLQSRARLWATCQSWASR